MLDAGVTAYYIAGGDYSSKTTLANMAGYVMSALSGGVAGNIDGVTTGSYSSSTGGGNPAFLLSPDQGSGRPSAFINYILFDETYTPLEAKSTPVQNNPGVLHQIALPAINVTQTGYLCVYLSYDNETGGQNVYFDEFKITYQESPVIQINSYYPFGMTAFSWVREGESQNKFLYQGKEYETLTSLHDFHARQFDAALGRWFEGDPAGQFSSPYLGMGNNPVMMTDPDGRWAGWDDVVIAAVGFVYGYLEHGFSHNDWGWDAVGNGAIHAAMFELGYLSGGTSAGLTGTAAMDAAGGYLATSAVNIAASQIVPAVPVYQSDNFSLSVSPTFSLDGIGASLNASYTSGDFTIGAGAGVTGTYGGGYESRIGGGVSYFDGTHGGSLAFTHFGGTDAQNNWLVGYRDRKFSATMTNDVGVGGDKYRTAAAELGWGDYSFGMNVYTNDATGSEILYGDAAKSKIWKEHIPRRGEIAGQDQGMWASGYRISSGMYFGVRRGGITYRTGVNAPFVKDFFQNGVHRYITRRTPYFQSGYGSGAKPYFFMRTTDPYSLW